MNIAIQGSQTDRAADISPSVVPGGTRLLGEIGPLQARLSANQEELEAAQRLRFAVFRSERGAAAPIAPNLNRDEDRFDAACDHLIVIDTSISGGAADRIVGTYRLLREDAAQLTGGFYSEAEYDVRAVTTRHPHRNFLELGRSCVLPAYRTKRTIELLWQGIWAYCVRHGIDVMMGCASFPGVVPAAHALPLSLLAHHAAACADWNTPPAIGDAVPLDMMPSEAVDTRAALSAMPPLIKGYLRLGAAFADHAVIDRDFGTTDVMVILPVEAISERYVRHYGADAARFAPQR